MFSVNEEFLFLLFYWVCVWHWYDCEISAWFSTISVRSESLHYHLQYVPVLSYSRCIVFINSNPIKWHCCQRHDFTILITILFICAIQARLCWMTKIKNNWITTWYYFNKTRFTTYLNRERGVDIYMFTISCKRPWHLFYRYLAITTTLNLLWHAIYLCSAMLVISFYMWTYCLTINCRFLALSKDLHSVLSYKGNVGIDSRLKSVLIGWSCLVNYNIWEPCKMSVQEKHENIKFEPRKVWKQR